LSPESTSAASPLLVHPTRYWFIWNGVTASEATNMPSRSSRMSGSEVAVEDMSRRPREAGARREARLARNAIDI